MNDPHVKTLRYRVITADNVDYEKANPIVVDMDSFTLNLDSNYANFEMKVHCATKEEAMEIVDTFIRQWDVLIGLEHDPGDLKFVFHNIDIIDRNPDITNSTTLNIHSSFHAHTAMSVALHASRGKFPSPPSCFSLSPDVETMYTRYKAYRAGRESLLSMAYMCLTVLEASAGSRPNAAIKYAIAKPVLIKLGTLCSERGGPGEARKRPKNGIFSPLSSQEKEWVAQVIKTMIRRVGEHEYNPKASLTQLTIDDFPSI